MVYCVEKKKPKKDDGKQTNAMSDQDIQNMVDDLFGDKVQIILTKNVGQYKKDHAYFSNIEQADILVSQGIAYYYHE